MAEANRTGPDRPTGLRRDRGPGSGLHWWAEVLLVLGFYAVYSAIRNLFGSESVEVAAALANAERIIDLEKALNLYVELDVQNAFLGSRWFIQFWNLFYGTFHFTVTVFVLVWVYRRFPHLYARHRSTFLCTTGLALVGFALFPLMPPRLLSDCGEYGACLATIHPYVDTVTDVGGLWSFDSGTMQKVSNQYAAMPSLHFAWATWSSLVLWPTLRGPSPSVRTRVGRWLVATYPPATLFAVVVTGNHYWLDAVGGLVVLGAGWLLSVLLVRAWVRSHRPAPAN
ncbi:MAG: phosphatase PAP2 family protein [Actinomycetota bacterium]|nr:phosphatase PAP2 family protein [Actinomycetota bacterium]MEE2958585.1 phosphatase PAP2 family protein [Actinomycetota bacterium]MEE3353274.1 phosphatase PAP2 family protein [Actinomycetota bacterium]